MTNSLSSLAQALRFRFGLRITSRRQVAQTTGRFLFRAVAASAVIVMIATNQDLAERAAVLEQVLAVYEPRISTMDACERGATAYAYESGRSFECSKPL
jgi:hypothetical protein